MFAEDSAPLSSGVMSGGVGTRDTGCSFADIVLELRSSGKMSGGSGISCWDWVALAEAIERPLEDVDDMGEKTSSWSYSGINSDAAPATSGICEL